MALRDRRKAMVSVRLRFHDDARVGPGKIALLEAVAQTGSVAGAGATLDMSARRAWLLIESLNNAFDQAVVVLAEDQHNSSRDDAAGQDQAVPEAALTELGSQLIRAYREVEQDTSLAVERRFADVIAQLRDAP